MAVYRDQAIVLRTQKLGEADRIITLFTKEHGRLRAVAKGVRRTKSKFGARLEPTSYVDLQLYSGKTFDIVTQAEGIENFGDALAMDYKNWTTANMRQSNQRLRGANEDHFQLRCSNPRSLSWT